MNARGWTRLECATVHKHHTASFLVFLSHFAAEQNWLIVPTLFFVPPLHIFLIAEQARQNETGERQSQGKLSKHKESKKVRTKVNSVIVAKQTNCVLPCTALLSHHLVKLGPEGHHRETFLLLPATSCLQLLLWPSQLALLESVGAEAEGPNSCRPFECKICMLRSPIKSVKGVPRSAQRLQNQHNQRTINSTRLSEKHTAQHIRQRSIWGPRSLPLTKLVQTREPKKSKFERNQNQNANSPRPHRSNRRRRRRRRLYSPYTPCLAFFSFVCACVCV